MYTSIALVGPAHAGKDTIAEHLVSAHGYARVAFADELKVMALEIDPVVNVGDAGCGIRTAHLSDVVRAVGWERAKREFPEVRRFLQRLGVTMRERDPDYWINLASPRFTDAELSEIPVVVTDCRFVNEAEYLIARGFIVVAVDRPGLSDDAFRQHVSETEMSKIPWEQRVSNVGTIADLNRRVDELLRWLS